MWNTIFQLYIDSKEWILLKFLIKQVGLMYCQSIGWKLLDLCSLFSVAFVESCIWKLRLFLDWFYLSRCKDVALENKIHIQKYYVMLSVLLGMHSKSLQKCLSHFMRLTQVLLYWHLDNELGFLLWFVYFWISKLRRLRYNRSSFFKEWAASRSSKFAFPTRWNKQFCI